VKEKGHMDCCFPAGRYWTKMGNPAEVREVFKSFRVELPMFTGVAVRDWSQPAQDPPDIEAELVDGKKVGIELTSWLEESQIGREKRVEIIENSFRDREVAFQSAGGVKRALSTQSRNNSARRISGTRPFCRAVLTALAYAF
jgi:hypothetical protein